MTIHTQNSYTGLLRKQAISPEFIQHKPKVGTFIGILWGSIKGSMNAIILGMKAFFRLEFI